MANLNHSSTSVPPFDPEHALRLLEQIDRQLSMAAAIAGASAIAEEQSYDPSYTNIDLFKSITALTENRNACSALRDMLESIPVPGAQQ